MSGNNKTLGGGGFHHVAIRTGDFDRSMKFYTEVMGFTVKIAWNEKPKRAVMLDTGDGNYLEIFERPNQAPPPAEEGAMLHMAFRTTDVDGITERARKAGAAVTMEPKSIDIPVTNIPGPVPVRISFFKGPDGEVIEMFQNDMT